MELNIPRHQTDPYYRYKMPMMEIQHLGKGNGVRTILVNFDKVMKALNRPLDYGIKFIGFEMGVKTKMDSTIIISGHHDVHQLLKCLDQFINLYVLCIKCQNPETLIVIKHQAVYLNCQACGFVSQVKFHKLSNYIIKNVKLTTNDKLIKSSLPVVNQEKWSLDTSDEAVNARKIKSDVYPSDVFIQFINTNPDQNQFVCALNRLKLEMMWSQTILIKYIFMSLFSNSIQKDFYYKLIYISYFINDDKDMMLILKCIVKLCEETQQLNDLIHVVNGFYEYDIIDEQVILKWYDELKDQNIVKHISTFIDWLK
jgi:translation initiation factor 5